MNQGEINYYNRQLRYKMPEEIVLWAFGIFNRAILTTSFGKQSAALIHLVTNHKPDIPVIWCDTGFYNEATYKFANSLQQHHNLNVCIYAPEHTSAYINFKFDNPTKTFNNFDEFVDMVKIRPLQRALQDHQPEIWFTNIREDQTSFRRKQNILSLTDEGILKVSPFYYCSDQEIKDYIEKYKLATNPDYFDVTKQRFGDECGIQLL